MSPHETLTLKALSKKINGVLLALICLISIPVWPGQTQQDLSEFEKRLAKISADIKVLKGRLQAEEKKAATILSALDKITFTKKIIKNELAIYSLQMDKATRELASLRKVVAEQKWSLAKEQAAVEKTVVTLYKFGKFSFLQFLLQAKNVSALFAESKLLTLLASYQQDIISHYLKTLAELKATTVELEGKQGELGRLIKEAQQKRKELEFQERENRALINQVIKNKATYAQTLNELNDRSNQLQILMKRIASQEIVLPLPFIPLYEKKGKLAWPMDSVGRGNLITRYGLQRHPQFNTITMNNGIEIVPRKDNKTVKAIHAGKVVYADYFQGYGDLLIIDHGLNYYSLYGHLAEFLVAKGDFVKAEQPIGIVGDTGSLKETPSCYLEIRYKAKALDPLQWLSKR